MNNIIILINNLFCNYKQNKAYSLAFETAFNINLPSKELGFIMFAQNNDFETDISQENDDYIMEVDDSSQKTSIWDRIKGAFNKQKALPDPNKEYTMDDWIKAQKNPISRAFTNIMESATHFVQSAFAKSQTKKMEYINIPTTPSQNFEKVTTVEVAQKNEIPTFIVPPAKPKAPSQTPAKPFAPLSNNLVVEEIKVINEPKIDKDNKGKVSGIEVEDIVLDESVAKKQVAPSNPKAVEDTDRDEL